MREQIEAKIAALQGELQKADEELSKLRPRVQYLETIMVRLDGALTALHDLRALDVPAVENGQHGMPQPAAS
jgi:septal ring factor EnvC (AmiA/AmiB activator)